MASSQPQDPSPVDLLPDEILLKIIGFAVEVPNENDGWSGSFVWMDSLVCVISNISERC